MKRKICENCLTGKRAYGLDDIPFCPHIANWKNNKCSFYEPIVQEKDSLLNKFLKLFKKV